jgi:hypothetical protein
LGFRLDDDFPKRLDLVEIDFIQVRFSYIETDLGFWSLAFVHGRFTQFVAISLRRPVVGQCDETAGCAWWNSLPDAAQRL